MKCQNHKTWILGLLVLLLSSPALASKSNGTMLVRAQVKAVLTASVLSQTTVLTISAEDIARGYIEVANATVMDIRSNSRDGYYLAFEGTGRPFSEIWVMDKGRTTVLSNGSGYIHQSSEMNRARKSLSYRFFLPQNTQPGSYAWPLAVNAVNN